MCFAVWRSRARIADAENPRAYVARIANNLAISHVRRETRDQSVEQSAHDISDPDSAAVDEAVDHLHQQTQLLAAVQELPLNWRLPITLTLEGFKPAEIAFVMGTNANSVSMRLSRAKKALRERLKSTSTSTEQGQGV